MRSTKLTPELLKEIAKKYISDKRKNNISVLAEEYGIPYPTLRRHLNRFILENDLEDLIREDQLPYEGFEYLSIGDTFQHAENLTIWEISMKKRVDGDVIFVIRPTKKKARRHWIGIELIITEDEEDNNGR